jgi:hypothetical protein
MEVEMTETATGDVADWKTRERVWKTRTTCLEARTKEFYKPILAVLHAMKVEAVEYCSFVTEFALSAL